MIQFKIICLRSWQRLSGAVLDYNNILLQKTIKYDPIHDPESRISKSNFILNPMQRICLGSTAKPTPECRGSTDPMSAHGLWCEHDISREQSWQQSWIIINNRYFYKKQ